MNGARRINISEMRWHIRALCKEAHLRRRWCKRNAYILFDGKGATGAITLYLPPIRGQREYAIALHELGHFFGRYQLPRYSVGLSEVGAWVWARENALIWTRAMRETAIRSLGTYMT